MFSYFCKRRPPQKRQRESAKRMRKSVSMRGFGSRRSDREQALEDRADPLSRASHVAEQTPLGVIADVTEAAGERPETRVGGIERVDRLIALDAEPALHAAEKTVAVDE